MVCARDGSCRRSGSIDARFRRCRARLRSATLAKGFHENYSRATIHAVTDVPETKRPAQSYRARRSQTSSFWTSAPSTRRSEQAAAVPASRNGLDRIVCQLIEKKNFKHGEVLLESRTRWGGIGGKGMPPRIASAMQFDGGLRNDASLVARARELVRARLAPTVAAGDRGCTIGRTAGDLIELHLAGKAVVEADDRHAEMQQVGDDREQRGLLATMLRGRRGEGAPDLAMQRAFHPEATGLVEEVRHLR